MDHPSRTDAPEDLDLTIAGPRDPIDALQADPEDADAAAAVESSEQQSVADTPFEMVEDEYTPTPLVGTLSAATVESETSDEMIEEESPVSDEALDDADEAESLTPTSTESDPTPQASAWEEDAEGGVDADAASVAQDDALVGAAAAVAGASDEVADQPTRTGAWWTLPLVFAGVGIVACALLVPAADENRRAMHELEKINRDVAYFERQSAVNKEFLDRVSSDPNLAERLAMRQLRMTRPDAKLAPIPTKAGEKFGMSPFALTALDPPPAVPEYRPLGGFLGRWFLDARRQMYFCGAGLLMIATGLICGGGNEKMLRRAEP